MPSTVVKKCRCLIVPTKSFMFNTIQIQGCFVWLYPKHWGSNSIGEQHSPTSTVAQWLSKPNALIFSRGFTIFSLQFSILLYSSDSWSLRTIYLSIIFLSACFFFGQQSSSSGDSKLHYLFPQHFNPTGFLSGLSTCHFVFEYESLQQYILSMN